MQRNGDSPPVDGQHNAPLTAAEMSTTGKDGNGQTSAAAVLPASEWTAGTWNRIDHGASERSSELGASAFQVYVAIARYANDQRRAWPGIARLSAMTGLSARWIRHAIRLLEKTGWLVVDRQPGNRNIYILPPIKSREPQFPTPELSKEPQFTTPGNPSSPGG